MKTNWHATLPAGAARAFPQDHPFERSSPMPLSDSVFDDLPSLVSDFRAWVDLRVALVLLSEQHPDRAKYVASEGNAGDALTAAGTWQFFDDLGLDPHYSALNRVGGGDVAIYAGGGNHRGCAAFLAHCLKVGVDAAVVMPHIVRGHERLLRRLDERFVLVCRDTLSLSRAQATGTRARLICAPDMALYVDVQRLFRRCRQYAGGRLWWRYLVEGSLLPYAVWRFTLRRRVPPRHGHVNLMRADAEATADHPGTPEWDVSLLYTSGFRFREESDMVARDFLGFFSRVSSVRTNRLHAGVAGALMGCDVTYFDNSYGKVEAVYDDWLSHLPFVSFNAGTKAEA